MTTTAADLLGVSLDAPAESIKQAYYRLARRLHPDHGGSPAEFAQVRSAYETLMSRFDRSAARAYQKPVRTSDDCDLRSPNVMFRIRRNVDGGSLLPEGGRVAESQADYSATKRRRLDGTPRFHQSYSRSRPDRWIHRPRWRSDEDRWQPSVFVRRGTAIPQFETAELHLRNRWKQSCSLAVSVVDRIPALQFIALIAFMAVLISATQSASALRGNFSGPVALAGFIGLPACIASLLGFDGHLGSRRVFVGVAAVMTALVAVASGFAVGSAGF